MIPKSGNRFSEKVMLNQTLASLGSASLCHTAARQRSMIASVAIKSDRAI